jgi:2-oxoisovalerate dehydrogenase E2 component (dihydrolipoyl transacylase)
MAEVRDFLMPDLGEGLTEGEIISWLVAEGDTVTVDQPIADLSTDKAVVQVPTPFAGRVVTLHGGPGDIVEVGKPLISIDVAVGENGAVRAADAATADAAATADGDAGSGNVLVGYGTSGEDTPVRRRRVALGDAPPAPERPSNAPPASPLVRRLAAELGIDLSSVAGTGPGGVVTRADLERAGASRKPENSAAMESAAGVATATAPATRDATRRPLTGVDRIAAERLTRSHREAPVATARVAADATRLLEVRAKLAEKHPDSHVTPFAVLLRLCVLALQRVPQLNAHFDSETNEVITFTPVHLGVAVQTDRGLIVPVIRDAEQKSVMQLCGELNRLATAARNGTIDAAELSGSTFTVSNFGAFGVDSGTAIINPPEAAILGVGRIADRPWAVGGGLTVRSVVELTLMFDHRVADGAVGGGFIRQLADLVEQPDEAMPDD